MVPLPLVVDPGVVCMLPLGLVGMVCVGVVWAKAAVFKPVANTKAKAVLSVFIGFRIR